VISDRKEEGGSYEHAQRVSSPNLCNVLFPPLPLALPIPTCGLWLPKKYRIRFVQ